MAKDPHPKPDAGSGADPPAPEEASGGDEGSAPDGRATRPLASTVSPAASDSPPPKPVLGPPVEPTAALGSKVHAAVPGPANAPDEPAPSKPSPTRPESDWAAEIAGRIDDVVAKVRSNTSDRLVRIARIVVFGLLAAFMATAAVVLLLIMIIRLLDVLIPGDVWIPYSVLGAIFVGAGLLLWSKRAAPAPDA